MMRCKICGKKIEADVSGIIVFVNGKPICTSCADTIKNGKKLTLDKVITDKDTAVEVEVKPKKVIQPKSKVETVLSADTKKDTSEPAPESKPVEEEGTIDL